MSLLIGVTGSVVEEQLTPTASVSADPQFGVIGSVVKLDGTASTNPTEDALTYTWEFTKVPIGSSVVQEGFKPLDSSGQVVSFSPDVVGEYLVSLTVSNGVYVSSPSQVQISIRAMLVPHGRGIVPDGKFIWSYLRDVWTQVEDKEWFETLWSALIQIVGADLLKVYQADFNKSIRDIQDLTQKRWLSYEPKLSITTNDCTFYIGNHCAGTGATTTDLGNIGQLIILAKSVAGPTVELIVTTGSVLHDIVGKTIDLLYDSRQADNVYSYTITGINSGKTGYVARVIDNPSTLAGTPPHPLTIPYPDDGRIVNDCYPIFDFQSTEWSFGDPAPLYAEWMSESPQPMDFLPPMFQRGASVVLGDLKIGDVVHVKNAPNAGFYRIVDMSGTTITVHKKPPGASTGTATADIYRPVGFRVEVPDSHVTDTFAIPYVPSTINPSTTASGRIVVINGSAYTVSRSVTDTEQLTPLILMSDNDGEILTGLVGASWRTPHTLISKSQNFEELGVSTGDRIAIDLFDVATQAVASVPCQVFGVDGNRIGVIITTEFPVQGVVPEVPLETYQSLAQTFGITSVLTDPTGVTILSGEAKSLSDYLNTGRFRTAYWNKELTSSDDIVVNGRKFRIQPRFIIRNRFVPVPDGLVSIPTLQNWIVQPDTITRDGKHYQLKSGKEYEIESLPVALIENIDYSINGQVAFYGDMTFNTGTDIIEYAAGHFVDRNIRPNDIFTIINPGAIAGDYRVLSVLSNTQLLLRSEVPRYVLSEEVTARIRITRKAKGEFIRFLPGGFSAKDPAPSRLWAEVSLFDNGDAIEGNFGLLVGLTRDDVNKISEPVNYRQAVTGLMYAFSQGTSTGKARLGAQILLGLPFAEHRGIIRSIDPDYRTDHNGVPTYGRIFAEDVDPNGVALGLFRVYTYPLDSQSSLSGLEINPDTGTEYSIGDTIALFAPLCKGVEITDYLDTDTSALQGAALVQRYNAMRLRASFRIFSEGEMDLVSSFLKKITPAYIAFIVSMTAEFTETIIERDSENHGLIMHPIDDASFGIPPSIMFDGKSGWAPYAYYDDGYYWVRKCGRDLVTTYSGTPSLTGVVTGNVITPAYSEGPVCKTGDRLVVLDGPNQGAYAISGVTETDITVSSVTLSPESGFQTATQGYMVLRKVSSEIRSGSGTYTDASTTVTLGSGLVADGVMPGDTLIIRDPGGTVYYRRTILRVGGAATADGYSPVLAAGEAQIDSLLPVNGTAQAYSIYRLSLNSPADLALTCTATPAAPDSNHVTLSDPKMKALLDSGDDLVITDTASRRYTVLDPFYIYVTPPLHAAATVRLEKRGASGSAVPFDQRNNNPQGVLTMHIRASDAIVADHPAAAVCNSTTDILLKTWTGASYTNYDVTGLSTHLQPAYPSGFLTDPDYGPILPGDYLKLVGGTNGTVDIGAGLGVYPIVQVVAPSTVRLAVALSSTESIAWKIIRRR